MAYRPSWQGHLKLSLVTCPVALYTATNAGGGLRHREVSFAIKRGCAGNDSNREGGS